jgi:hypothetical protein
VVEANTEREKEQRLENEKERRKEKKETFRLHTLPCHHSRCRFFFFFYRTYIFFKHIHLGLRVFYGVIFSPIIHMYSACPIITITTCTYKEEEEKKTSSVFERFSYKTDTIITD